VEAWHLGIQTGHAVADVLFGKYNPSGKLPITFPRTVGQVPIYYNHKATGRPEMRQYCDCDASPLYPFGYGLSYTTFEYQNLSVSSKTLPLDGELKVSVDIANTGERDGEETVQLYIQDVSASVTRPVKELKGFQKIALFAGATTRVEFTIRVQDLGFIDSLGNYVVEPGQFHVWVGPNSSEGLKETFTVISA
jgi:beta-glucosidase